MNFLSDVGMLLHQDETIVISWLHLCGKKFRRQKDSLCLVTHQEDRPILYGVTPYCTAPTVPSNLRWTSEEIEAERT